MRRKDPTGSRRSNTTTMETDKSCPAQHGKCAQVYIRRLLPGNQVGLQKITLNHLDYHKITL
jgi:hypothetical protein